MYTAIQEPLSHGEFASLLKSIDNVKMGLIGDLCLDVYWAADMRLSELSRETPHYPLPIIEERYSLGGAGNVAANLAALNPSEVWAVGTVGDDWRADLLIREMNKRNINCSYVLRSPDLVTNTYIKPLRHGISDVVYEDPRLDFENRKALSSENEKRVLLALEEMAEQVDCICVSDQMKFGCITPAVRQKLCQLGEAGKIVIVDSRDHIHEYSNVIIKPNEVEMVKSFAAEIDGEMSIEQLTELAKKVSLCNNQAVVTTLGAQGCLVVQGRDAQRCPAYEVEPPIDFCGAGDSFLSGFATALATGKADAVQAAQIATMCSAVTIKKIGTTGTASRAELQALWGKRIIGG